MSPCRSTLGCGSGDASGVASGVFTLKSGVTCGAEACLNISESFLRAAVCLSSNSVSGLEGVGPRREWVRSAAACFASSFDEILGNVSVSGKNSVV